MTIQYNPEGLRWIIESPLVKKRLNNRDAQVTCSCGNFRREDRILLLLPDVFEHDKNNPDHVIMITENICGMGLL